MEKKMRAKTGSRLAKDIAETTGITVQRVKMVLQAYYAEIQKSMMKGGPQQFCFPGMFKIFRKIRPPVPERKGIHPITRMPTVYKARPAKVVYRIRLLKGFKDIPQ